VVEAYRLRHQSNTGSKIVSVSSPPPTTATSGPNNVENTPLKSPSQHMNMHHFTSPGTPTTPGHAASSFSPHAVMKGGMDRDQYKSIIESYQKTIAELRFKL
jgi:hypothetical protein